MLSKKFTVKGEKRIAKWVKTNTHKLLPLAASQFFSSMLPPFADQLTVTRLYIFKSPANVYSLTYLVKLT